MSVLLSGSYSRPACWETSVMRVGVQMHLGVLVVFHLDRKDGVLGRRVRIAQRLPVAKGIGILGIGTCRRVIGELPVQLFVRHGAQRDFEAVEHRDNSPVVLDRSIGRLTTFGRGCNRPGEIAATTDQRQQHQDTQAWTHQTSYKTQKRGRRDMHISPPPPLKWEKFTRRKSP